MPPSPAAPVSAVLLQDSLVQVLFDHPVTLNPGALPTQIKLAFPTPPTTRYASGQNASNELLELIDWPPSGNPTHVAYTPGTPARLLDPRGIPVPAFNVTLPFP